MDCCTRSVSNNRETGNLQFVLPRPFRKQPLEACHDEVGLLGIERTSLIKDRFYWPGMEDDIEEYVKTWPRCLKFKAILEKGRVEHYRCYQTLGNWYILIFLTIKAPKKDKRCKYPCSHRSFH